MKPIKVTKTEEIKKALKMVEGRATSFCLYPSRIDSAVKQAEQTLQGLRIPKRFWNGCYIIMKPASPPNAYNWRANGTFVTLVRKSKDWFVVNITRSVNRSCSGGRASREILHLTENQIKHMPTQFEL